MGFDYYRGTFITFVYKDSQGEEKTHTLQINKEGCYYDDFDRDFMTVEEYFNKLLKLNLYSTKDIYSNGSWRCVMDRVDMYKNYMTKIEDMAELVRIYKSVDFWER